MSTATMPGYFERYRRPIVGAALVACLAALVTFEPVAERYDGLPMIDEIVENLEILGLMLIVMAIAGRAWCTLYIGGRKSQELVADGPYSITRNPLYVFSTIGATGAGAISESIIITLAAGVGAYVVSNLLIKAEEVRLEELFGETFRAYMARVPRFWPNLKLYEDGGEVTFSPRFLMSTVKDGLVFLAAYPFFEGIELLHEWGTIPVLFRLW